MASFTIPSIPSEFTWQIDPSAWAFEPATGLSITAGAQTDLFADPAGEYAKDNAPYAVMTPPDSHFLLSAKVAVEFGSKFDAGTLQIRTTEGESGKLCFEYSPQGQPMIVSVVTHGISDDANSVLIEGNEVYLRAAKTPNTVAFHYSLDGQVWHFVRYFWLANLESVRVGFSAQSPTGERCTAIFSQFHYHAGQLADNRSGE